LKPDQPYAAGLDWLKGLYFVVPEESQNPSETSEGLTHAYYITKKPIISDHNLGKIK